ncbi:MAG: double-strand break repair protein AddB, partial [Alphaproteobacteria bacterium]
LMARPGVFTIPAGVAFLDVLARGVLEQARGEAFALADTLIMLPTRRSARALAEAFLRVSGGTALALPRVLTLGDIDDGEPWPFDDGVAGAEARDVPPAISQTRRLLLLARLVQGFRSDGAPRTAGQAVRLARELALLLDRVETERVDFSRLGDLVPERFADHWKLTLEFLSIVTEAWPKILAAEGVIDPANRQDLVLTARADHWRKFPPAGRVIAAGSTGSIPATADVLDAVARLPQGAVVLPALDREIDDESWAQLAPSHPQFGLARLLARLGIDRDQVEDWPGDFDPPPSPGRARLVAETMRPAATTEHWRQLSKISRDAAEGLRRIDCPGPAEEAQVIALLLREALEIPGRTASLVTSDRGLARRVAAELGRWRIDIDDSAGLPLGATPPGVFLRLTAAMAEDRFAPIALLAALKHPLAACGFSPGAFRAQTRALEAAVLRGPRPAQGIAGLRSALEAARLAPRARGELGRMIDALEGAAAPFVAALADGGADLGALLRAHVAFAEALAATTEEDGASRLWAGEAGEVAARFVGDLADGAARGAPALGATGGSYAALLDDLMDGAVVRPRHASHPRLRILGPLEARMQQADLTVLGGLNEGTWPRHTQPDPWLSRPMQLTFGLPEPERRVGLAAHDFAVALAAPGVVLTRATRGEGTPTVPSRWLARLEAVLRGANLFEPMQAARRWIDSPVLPLAAMLDGPDTAARAFPPVERPAPRPPLSARPRELSVTEIRRLMRDPYAVYARRILRLEALEDIDEAADAATRGQIVHRVLHRFLRDHPDRLPEDALGRLLAIGRREFDEAAVRPAVRALWWPRLVRIAEWFVATQSARTERVAATECTGRLEWDAPRGRFALVARADRIDVLADGRLAIIDYKTGGVPKTNDVVSGDQPQLPLEAAIATSGGFAGVPGAEVAELAYWELTGGAAPGQITVINGDAAPLGEAAREGLARLVAAFDDEAQPYTASDDPDFGEYAHLSRVKEWS